MYPYNAYGGCINVHWCAMCKCACIWDTCCSFLWKPNLKVLPLKQTNFPQYPFSQLLQFHKTAANYGNSSFKQHARSTFPALTQEFSHCTYFVTKDAGIKHCRHFGFGSDGKTLPKAHHLQTNMTNNSLSSSRYIASSYYWKIVKQHVFKCFLQWTTIRFTFEVLK